MRQAPCRPASRALPGQHYGMKGSGDQPLPASALLACARMQSSSQGGLWRTPTLFHATPHTCLAHAEQLSVSSRVDTRMKSVVPQGAVRGVHIEPGSTHAVLRRVAEALRYTAELELLQAPGLPFSLPKVHRAQTPMCTVTHTHTHTAAAKHA